MVKKIISIDPSFLGEKKSRKSRRVNSIQSFQNDFDLNKSEKKKR
jgi:hypothetical protein